MNCKWNHSDCKYINEKCYLCFIEDQYYTSNIKIKEPKKAKETKRKGSKFEAINSNNNNAILLAASRPTPNSGAGYIKGDEQICGLVNTMEELKEQNSVNAKGEKTFTIHKQWLDKLNREAKAENKEFWYLKFCFSTQDALNLIHYVIIESDMLMSMIKTMWEDRKKAKTYQQEIDLYKAKANRIEAENLLLRAQIEELKCENELLKNKNMI